MAHPPQKANAHDSCRAVTRLGLVATAILATLLVAAGPSLALGRETNGAQLRVGMQGQRFTPARVVATVGDSVRFELESGGPHNVAFDPDSIPPGSRERLARSMGSDPRFLATPVMLLDRGETFTLSLGDLPPGKYRFYCSPHLAGGMTGEITLLARGP